MVGLWLWCWEYEDNRKRNIYIPQWLDYGFVPEELQEETVEIYIPQWLDYGSALKKPYYS